MDGLSEPGMRLWAEKGWGQEMAQALALSKLPLSNC